MVVTDWINRLLRFAIRWPCKYCRALIEDGAVAIGGEVLANDKTLVETY